MDDLSASMIIKALDGLSTRASATAENIANAGTPHYRPLRVSFERALADAAPRGPAAVGKVHATIEQSPSSAGAMRLDLEVQTAASTALRYSALIDILGRQMQLESMAIKGSD